MARGSRRPRRVALATFAQGFENLFAAARSGGWECVFLFLFRGDNLFLKLAAVRAWFGMARGPVVIISLISKFLGSV